jgi:hypothetical protein
LGHPAPDRRRLVQQMDIGAQLSKVQGCLYPGNSGTDNEN